MQIVNNSNRMEVHTVFVAIESSTTIAYTTSANVISSPLSSKHTSFRSQHLLDGSLSFPVSLN
jgi:hypothetical protein